MKIPLLPFARLILALSLFLADGFAEQPFTLSTELVREGKPEGGRWTIPRVAAWARMAGKC